jgi:hypothetical protein
MSLTRRNTFLLVGVLLMLALAPPCVASACEARPDACCQAALGRTQLPDGAGLIVLAVVSEPDRPSWSSDASLGPAATASLSAPCPSSPVPLRI